jgi:probable rRNA maturation factor
MMDIDIQIASHYSPLPTSTDLARWAETTLKHQHTTADLTIRIVDEAEIIELNEHYRGKHKATNVLSFPMEALSEAEATLLGESDNYLGDIVICAPVVAAEAAQQRKTFEAHFAHMVVHGTLHLMGYDHVTTALAEVMEPLEVQILASMQFPNPYEANDRNE